MRGAADALRTGFSLPARPPWGYGVLCGTAVAAPLLAGALAGDLRTGGLVALGTYLTAFGDTYGQPYGTRARNLFGQVVLIMLGFWLGSLVGPYPWVAVVCIGLVACAAGHWEAVGMSPVLATVIGFYDHLPPSWGPSALLGLGGLLFCAFALALWPVRRLDPLRQALREAAEALADMLDGLDLPEEDWVEARERASEALEEAGTAAAPFHNADDERSPDRYVAALTRVFHESVALRTLRAQALEARPTVPRLDEAVAALSEALREEDPEALREAIAAAGEFAEYAANVRVGGETDPEELRYAALLGQVRRCVDRIAVAVRASGVAERVRAAPRLPRLSWQIPVITRPPRHAGRLGLATALAMALAVTIREPYAIWFVFTVLVGLQSTYGDTVDRVVLRVAGTVVGTAVAALILAVVPGPLTVVLIVWTFATIGFALREVSYAYWSVVATPLALMLTDFSTRIDWHAAGVRLLLTAAGGVAALLAARLLWPRGEAGRINGRVVDLLRTHGRLVRTLAERDLDELADHIEEAGRTADRLTESLDRLEKEPGGRAPAELRHAVDEARKVRDDVMLLSAVIRGGDTGWDATAAILDMVADRLETVAEAVKKGSRAPEGDELDWALAALASRVDTLMEEAAIREDTAVRRELRHTVAAHPALRAICADALRLGERVA
ncbi:FUSC family protein [Nonomuraea sp. NPDC046570]|uniref:FUSC family protein n=1 Tax=Nonomuraea sp. NPDC046570 TaxID=3155255 RepID=UPI00340A78DE